jgi:DNA-binding CsgD family transcriptional regulator
VEESWGPAGRGRARKLVGRDQEVRVLEDLLAAVRSGDSRALVVHGEPGAGKTALVDYLSEQAADCRVVSVTGVEAEMELSFAALHQLCAPMLERLRLLPLPQREALEVTFGISAGPVPERVLVGLATLSLMAEVAVERPLLCLVDDAQWLDRASAQIVAFVARRLGTESVGIVISTRHPARELAGLPELAIEGLGPEHARALLASALTGPVDARVLDEIVAETRGNPLALLELPRGLTTTELAGGFALPGAAELSGSIEESFRRRVEVLPANTQNLLLVAAADPLGDPLLLWRAAELLGIDASAGRAAVDDELVSFGARVRFRHPLVRSAVYRSASAEAKREAHGALAEATDPAIDPERRAWHRAQMVAGPDEEVAVELERYAGRAQERGGLAAAAAFLERATTLSSDRAKRAARALAAGQAKIQAGGYGAASELLAVAQSGPLDELDQARVDLARAQLAFATSRGSEAPGLLLKAAQRLEPIDVGLARATYLDALIAATLAGRFAGPEANVPAVARAAGAAPRSPHRPAPPDLLLDGMAANYNQGYAAGLPLVRAAVAADSAGMPVDQELRWLSLAYRAAMSIWDDDRMLTLSARCVQLAREVGALSELALAINDRAILLLLTGEPSAAASAVEEAYATAEAVGNTFVPYGAMAVAAWRGEETEASRLIEAHRSNATMRGEGAGMAGAEWADAVLNNGLGRFDKAAAAARRAVESTGQWVFELSNWTLVELIEAAARTGASETAAEAHHQLAEMAAADGSDWVLGVEERARALVSRDETAEKLYRGSIERLGVTHMKAELARTHLLFGEWLRRQSRRVDARTHLHSALEILEFVGMEGFAERARRELRATGETARKRRPETRGDLTPQEAQVAQLAREGMSNPEIAARLYISARTVQYHLSKVFAKLGISSRSQLDRALK